MPPIASKYDTRTNTHVPIYPALKWHSPTSVAMCLYVLRRILSTSRQFQFSIILRLLKTDSSAVSPADTGALHMEGCQMIHAVGVLSLFLDLIFLLELIVME